MAHRENKERLIEIREQDLLVDGRATLGTRQHRTTFGHVFDARFAIPGVRNQHPIADDDWIR